MNARKIEAAGATHIGHVREINEDKYVIGGRGWAVADGLGGHAGGEVASLLAVDAATHRLERHDADRPEHAIVHAFREAHEAILIVASEEPGLEEMGTTLVLALHVDDGRVHIGNVGDSRAYLLADGRMSQITVDDNAAQELFERGEITADEARVHEGQFLLNKALGLGDPQAPEPRLHVIEAATGRLLLCSDGLTSEVLDEDIMRLLAEGTPAEASDRLITAALDAGGNDNVTVVVIDL